MLVHLYLASALGSGRLKKTDLSQTDLFTISLPVLFSVGFSHGGEWIRDGRIRKDVVILWLFLSSSFKFIGTGVLNAGPHTARQGLYHLNHAPQSLKFRAAINILDSESEGRRGKPVSCCFPGYRGHWWN